MPRKAKAAVANHSAVDTLVSREGAAASQKAAAGHTGPDTQAMLVGDAVQKNLDVHHSGDGAAPYASAADLYRPGALPASVSALAPTISEIRFWHRQRVFAMDQRKRSDLALGAFVRTQLGWSRNLPKAEADKIAKAARDLIELGEKICKGKETGIGNVAWGQWGAVVLASIQGRAHWDAIEGTAVKEMERLGKSLPVWGAFGEEIKGFGARSLSVIIGEAGDLSLYANPAKLWKRMGLAVMDGVRQGGLRKTAGAEAWIAHGYNAKRRSFMFVIGDVLVKNQNRYRDLYLQRKDIERAKAAERGLTVAPAAKIPAKRKDEFMSDGHVHRRAQRYMEKRLLKELWQAWRRASTPLKPLVPVPAAEIPQAIKTPLPVVSAPAERSAIPFAETMAELPSASLPAKAGKATDLVGGDTPGTLVRRKNRVRA